MELIEKDNREDIDSLCSEGHFQNTFVPTDHPIKFQSALTLAVLRCDYELLNYILHLEGMDIEEPDPLGRTVLAQTVILRSFRGLEIMLENGAEVNVSDLTRLTPLGHAFRLLLEDLRRFESRVICLKMIGAMLAHGADPNSFYNKAREETLLFTVCIFSQHVAHPLQLSDLAKAIRLLLRHGASPYLLNFEGTSVLDMQLDPSISALFRDDNRGK
jgi:hypothetical protein